VRAYRILDWQQGPQFAEAPVPRPGPGQVLVRVAANGLCHSDAMMSQVPEEFGRQLGWEVPFTLGHEVGGWVWDLADDVEGLGSGDAVALVSAHSCGTCHECLRGRDSICTSSTFGRGFGRDGGLAPFVLAGSVREIVPLRSVDPVIAGPLTDAGATSYHAVKRVLPRLEPGSTAVVIGAGGGLGSFAVQFLRALSPARVVAVDTADDRLAFATSLGAHESLVGVDATTAPSIRELTDGDGAAAVLDFVGIDATIEAGLAATRMAGAFAVVGAAGGTFRRPWYGGLPREADVFTFQGSDIADVHDVVALAERGLVQSVVARFDFDDVAQAYEQLDHGELHGRAVVIPDEV
jgi:propanol-preferring alcohol dehydrogenase